MGTEAKKNFKIPPITFSRKPKTDKTKMSRVRQNFHEESEASINKQINMEMHASYVYLAMSSFFNREDQALHQAQGSDESGDGKSANDVIEHLEADLEDGIAVFSPAKKKEQAPAQPKRGAPPRGKKDGGELKSVDDA